VLAANVDLVVVVASLTRELSVGRIERMLTLAADAPAEALVVLSKSDLDPDPPARVAEVRAALAGGATVLPLSIVDGTGVDAVEAMLGPGVTGVLLGASGVGKTSLLNRLAGGDRATAPVRGADDRGRHTTTWRELVPLAGGGVVIDTPGLKLPRIWEQAQGLSAVFADVEAIAATCRFADCQHAGEPGCAVAEALADGRLTPERVAALEQLRREQAWADTRRDHRLRRERKEATRRLQRELRRTLKAKGR
jgi:ribosome biogenesis GTPase / thiamine phosphate phosphatase